MGHEEGRIRPVFDATNALTSFEYDYFLKDHLGNVRMVITEERKLDHIQPLRMRMPQFPMSNYITRM